MDNNFVGCLVLLCAAFSCKAEENEIDTIKVMLYEQQNQIEQLNIMREKDKLIGDAQRLVIQTLTQRIEAIENTRARTSDRSSVQDSHQTNGCLAQEMQLSCSSGQHINVTRAYFGKSQSCSTGCCPPNSNDCKELVSDNSQAQWALLKSVCNGKEQCNHTYMGGVIDSCVNNYIADYMEIRYDCLLYDDYAPVGFSAYATSHRQYNKNDIIVFSGVVSNIGNHYDPDTSKFTCPYNGLYLFSVNMNANGYNQMYAEIVRDDEYLVGAMASNANGDSYSHASAFTIAECNVGQAVWVRSGYSNSYMYGSSGRRSSQFSGALIYAYV